MQLTREQIERFDRDGFLVIPDLLTPEEVRALQHETEHYHETLAGGMPPYKFVANRALTLVQNIMLGQKLSEYHTGYRAFSRQVLEKLPLEENSNDFLFDNQMLTQVVYFGFRIGEVSCPTKYFEEASSIGFFRSVRYGVGCLGSSALFVSARWKLYTPRFLSPEGRRLSPRAAPGSEGVGGVG